MWVNMILDSKRCGERVVFTTVYLYLFKISITLMSLSATVHNYFVKDDRRSVRKRVEYLEILKLCHGNSF